MKTLALTLALTFATPIIAAESLPEIVKKNALPDLRGGRTIKVGPADGIPTCFNGTRAKLSADDNTVKAWASSHAKHVCADATTVYVCRAGQNLSVKCE